MAVKRKDGRGAKGLRAPGSTSWVLGRRSAPFLVEKPERHRPELLVLIDVGASRMVALEAVSPGQTAEAVAEWAGPKVESGVTLRVDSEELALALRARLGARADVFVAETPEVDEAIESLEEFTDRQRAERGRDPDWADDVPRAAKAGFYEAAARFETVEPWRSSSSSTIRCRA